jgi:uncharacterized protein (TIGR03032 family)
MTNDQNQPASEAGEPWLQVQGSRHFIDWLTEVRASLAFSTYQTGKIFFVGRKPDMGLAVFERTFNHCMGLWASPDSQTIWLSSKYQIWRFEQAAAAVVPYQRTPAEGDDAASPAWTERGYDVVYMPRIGYTTGDVDVHDIAVAADGVAIGLVFDCRRRVPVQVYDYAKRGAFFLDWLAIEPRHCQTELTTNSTTTLSKTRIKLR